MTSAAPDTSQLRLQFKIHGMDCAEEVAVLKQVVGPVVGGEDRLAFDILNAKMIVAATANGPSAADVVDAVQSTGMRAERWHDGEPAKEGSTLWERSGRTILTVVSGGALLIGFGLHVAMAGSVSGALGSEGMGLATEMPLAVRVLYGIAILAGGWFVAPKAWYAIQRVRPDMNLLMTIAVAGAIGIGEWFEGATVAFLFALSLTLEAWSVGRARRAIEALMELAPPVARLLKDGVQTEVPADLVPVGSLVLVRPGEKIPLDGVVVRGTSGVNQAPITGESVPVTKETGAQVFAGTINGDGALEVQTTKAANDTTLAHIIRMVGEASSRRAPSEQWVERFARIYTPAVLAVAILVLLVPPLLFDGSWSDWGYRSLVFLVIGCPCALVISTPVTIVAALAASAKNGVLVKGGAYMEAPAQLKAIAVDKTGTLTRGEPEVQEIVPLNGHDEASLLERLVGMEMQTDHPLARAIVAYGQARSIVPLAVEEFAILQGKGATGRISGAGFWVGSHRYLEERGQETPEIHSRIELMAAAGRSVVVAGDDREVWGLVTLADAVRPESRAIVQSLRDQGIEHVVMLTGDNLATANAIAAQTGLEEVRADLLPADKVSAIESLVQKYGSVAMVGDGVNDAPAMARATLGIAMGAAGSDAAIETADIALMSDDLSKLPWLIRHSKRTLGIVRQNIALSLTVKALFVALTFAGVASLWAAIAADMGVSLLVILNALRLLSSSDTVRNDADRSTQSGKRASVESGQSS